MGGEGAEREVGRLKKEMETFLSKSVSFYKESEKKGEISDIFQNLSRFRTSLQIRCAGRTKSKKQLWENEY